MVLFMDVTGLLLCTEALAETANSADSLELFWQAQQACTTQQY